MIISENTKKAYNMLTSAVRVGSVDLEPIEKAVGRKYQIWSNLYYGRLQEIRPESAVLVAVYSSEDYMNFVESMLSLHELLEKRQSVVAETYNTSDRVCRGIMYFQATSQVYKYKFDAYSSQASLYTLDFTEYCVQYLKSALTLRQMKSSGSTMQRSVDTDTKASQLLMNSHEILGAFLDSAKKISSPTSVWQSLQYVRADVLSQPDFTANAEDVQQLFAALDAAAEYEMKASEVIDGMMTSQTHVRPATSLLPILATNTTH